MFSSVLIALSLFQLSLGNTECKPQDTPESVVCYDLTNETSIEDAFENSTVTRLTVSGCDPNLTLSRGFLQQLDKLQRLHLVNCQNGASIFANFQHLHRLQSLSIRKSSLEDFEYNCDSLKKLETLDLSENNLVKFSVSEDCNQIHSLKKLNLSRNDFRYFKWKTLSHFPVLEEFDFSHNIHLEQLKPNLIELSNLTTLDLSYNSKLASVCSSVIQSVPKTTNIDLSNTRLKTIPLQLFSSHLNVQPPLNNPQCSCELIMFQNISCIHQNALVEIEEVISELDCQAAQIGSYQNQTLTFAGETVTLECGIMGHPSPHIMWLTPRLELVKYQPDISANCDGIIETVSLCDSIECDDHVTPSAPGQFTVMDNGSLVIQRFGWRDRGEYECYVDNNIGNESVIITTKLDHGYRHVIYLWSLLYGLVTAVGFLIFTLLCKLIHYLAWNYGCCSCCRSDPPPKIKRIAAALDSIEQYRIGQLEKLRENYTQQSQRIRDNYNLQLERLRETYTSQKKENGGAGGGGVKEQYWDNVNRVRDYSNMQLTKLHENYIFQRQRLRKFSVQNYVKIRETGKYTQKTLNRVIENMPTLTEMTNCRQGGPDWDNDDDENDPAQMELLMMIKEEDSLYFTPDGTPQREVAPTAVGGTDIVSPGPSSKDKRKSHKRMVSNLSNFIPFWWGMGQSDMDSNTTTTVAVIEHDRPQQEQMENSASVSVDNIHLVIHTESSEVTSSGSSVTPTTPSLSDHASHVSQSS